MIVFGPCLTFTRRPRGKSLGEPKTRQTEQRGHIQTEIATGFGAVVRRFFEFRFQRLPQKCLTPIWTG